MQDGHTDAQTDIHDETDSRVWQFCERAKNAPWSWSTALSAV